MTTQVTKQINARGNLSVETGEKDTWQEVTILKLKSKKKQLKNASRQQGGKTKTSLNPDGEDESPRSNPQSFEMQEVSRKKNQPVGNRKEIHPRN